jgi:hypothetical protein
MNLAKEGHELIATSGRDALYKYGVNVRIEERL